jgi:hypothetical protein
VPSARRSRNLRLFRQRPDAQAHRHQLHRYRRIDRGEPMSLYIIVPPSGSPLTVCCCACGFQGWIL